MQSHSSCCCCCCQTETESPLGAGPRTVKSAPSYHPPTHQPAPVCTTPLPTPPTPQQQSACCYLLPHPRRSRPPPLLEQRHPSDCPSVGCPSEARRKALSLLGEAPLNHTSHPQPWSRPRPSRPWMARTPSTHARAVVRYALPLSHCAAYSTWSLTVCADIGGGQSLRAWYVSAVPLNTHLSPLTSSQPATDGTSTASAVIHAALCSTLTPICSCSATALSFATIARTAAMHAATRSKIWPSSPAIKPSAPAASDVAIARGRLRICVMRARHRASSA